MGLSAYHYQGGYYGWYECSEGVYDSTYIRTLDIGLRLTVGARYIFWKGFYGLAFFAPTAVHQEENYHDDEDFFTSMAALGAGKRFLFGKRKRQEIDLEFALMYLPYGVWNEFEIKPNLTFDYGIRF